MEKAKETLVDWLNDAYGMEKQQVEVLDSHIKHAEGNPEIRRGLERHRDETSRQVDRVGRCIELLGSKPSTTKGAVSKMMGMFQGPATGMAKDDLVKDALMDYAAEHFEIASYKALIEASRNLGEEEVARTCEEILQEEERMASWLEQNLPKVVHQFVTPQAAATAR